MTPNPTVFATIVAAAVLLFAWSCFRRFKLVTLGRAENRFEDVGARLRGMLVYAFGQKRVLQKPFGINHFLLFWAFLILLVANGEFILKGLDPSITFMAWPASSHNVIYAVFDAVSLIALVAVIVAAVRRLVARPYPEALTLDAYVVLGMIAVLMVAYFNLHGLELASGEISATMPISALVGSWFYAGITPGDAGPLIEFWWWTHAIILLTFLNYLPYSKHIHILASIPSCYFRREGHANTLSVEHFEVGATFGVGRFDQFTWKDLFDSYACTECGRCQMACPAYLTGKPLNPREVIHDLKLNMLVNGDIVSDGGEPLVPLIGRTPKSAAAVAGVRPEDSGAPAHGSIGEDAIWSCTSCGACMEVCPVFIEQMPKILQMRRYLVETEADFPAELLNLFANMEQRSNPWGIAPSERTKWCASLGVRPFDESCEYLLFVGCAGAFDARNKQVTMALARVLDAAGISWGILGKDEHCCGDSLRRLGNEYVFDRIARENVDLFTQRGVRKVITMCPHCYSTLSNDYRQFGFDGEVVSHVEFVRDLVAGGMITVEVPKSETGTLTFHDSCYLGRHNDIYDAPREVICAATGNEPTEMERHRSHSFCCGAGGGRMWMEEDLGTRINLERVREALDTGADTVCVSCPYCMTMFEDGLKDLGADHVAVRDVAEVVAAGLK